MERVEKTFLDFLWELRETDPGFVGEIEKRFDKWYIDSDPYKLAAKKIMAWLAGDGFVKTVRDERDLLEGYARIMRETIPPPVIPDIAKGAEHLKKLIGDPNHTYSEIELIESLLKFWGFQI